jgi:hypothetical protein
MQSIISQRQFRQEDESALSDFEDSTPSRGFMNLKKITIEKKVAFHDDSEVVPQSPALQANCSGVKSPSKLRKVMMAAYRKQNDFYQAPKGSDSSYEIVLEACSS